MADRGQVSGRELVLFLHCGKPDTEEILYRDFVQTYQGGERI
ncbi:hypothetical protein [Parablautia sp. Marseille-Q6255]|nr:hypothetical protein [Parablautia sp. Marseille-Q6255]